MRLSRRVVLVAALAMAGGGFYLLNRPTGSENDDLEGLARKLGEQQGLTIGFGDPKTFFMPPYVAADAQIEGVAFEPVDRAMVTASLKGIAKAFDAYPEKCLGRIIKAIFIAGKIVINGAEVGGTYGQDWIFVASPRNLPDESRQLTAELDVHHETSSFVWLRNSPLQAAFKAQEPADWRFETDAADQVSRGQGANPPIETGFLSAYGATTAENDFNTYAEVIFSDPARMKDMASKVPLVAKKLNLVLRAYMEIDPRLHETFSRMGLLAIAAG
ncbi:hypothetical protein [Phyllobacterium sp. P30BS-XVII]|uniref:hypothetical protein n=1 Tax=Phyllobacterium sp. P30BS-XVII TaxID=2587046 RepID=UPI0015FA734A|nr:hypothetical protein [Phyllobacterium sp. P30BS-XVII]MBA8903621.1 hypothetical protein [Phyllobacterium sp. P30BS-XVII]